MSLERRRSFLFIFAVFVVDLEGGPAWFAQATTATSPRADSSLAVNRSLFLRPVCCLSVCALAPRPGTTRALREADKDRVQGEFVKFMKAPFMKASTAKAVAARRTDGSNGRRPLLSKTDVERIFKVLSERSTVLRR